MQGYIFAQFQKKKYVCKAFSGKWKGCRFLFFNIVDPKELKVTKKQKVNRNLK